MCNLIPKANAYLSDNYISVIIIPIYLKRYLSIHIIAYGWNFVNAEIRFFHQVLATIGHIKKYTAQKDGIFFGLSDRNRTCAHTVGAYCSIH